MWVSAVLVGVLAVSGPAPSSQRVEEARAEVLGDEYQAELPRYVDGNRSRPRALPPRRAGDRLIIPADGARDRDGGGDVDIGPFGVLLQYLMWGVAIVGAAIAAYWLAAELSRYGGDASLADDETAEAAGVDLGIIERPLGDADELARQGLYAEAIHTLLLRTLQELARSAAVRVAPAQTSREILARVPLLADARTALAGLITAVEVTHFGDDVPGVDDYARCRQQFHVFATAFRARPA